MGWHIQTLSFCNSLEAVFLPVNSPVKISINHIAKCFDACVEAYKNWYEMKNVNTFLEITSMREVFDIHARKPLMILDIRVIA